MSCTVTVCELGSALCLLYLVVQLGGGMRCTGTGCETGGGMMCIVSGCATGGRHEVYCNRLCNWGAA